ncbi:hypothetical protein DFH08DRAFT_869222 [Mycena albidolilacea]|uniref:Uncharacterized protein n=1 Tax=Mycena albidolilacea TaxID=1033008 RepID=A0AAD7A027_9AGAR|nr:hypothetical protein DFH08DRAFT_869222 [Mycena albidolilacea]
MENGVPTRLDTVTADKVGRKLRLAGQVLAYDAETGVVLLWARDVAALVDASNCVSAWGVAEWLKERLCTVEVVGYLEHAPADLRVPPLPDHFPLTAPQVDEGIIMRASLVVARRDLSLSVWKEGQENNGSRRGGGDSSYPGFVLLPN